MSQSVVAQTLLKFPQPGWCASITFIVPAISVWFVGVLEKVVIVVKNDAWDSFLQND